MTLRGAPYSEVRRLASGVPKTMGPEVNSFLFALCKGACFSELTHGSALPAWRITPRLFRVARCLCFWRALSQSAQAEQDTLILCSSQESVSC